MINKFKLARLLTGKKQVDVSRETSIHPATLSLIENGRLIPTPKMVERLKKVLPNLD